MINNFIKNLFWFSKRNGQGALLDEFDYRDITYASVAKLSGLSKNDAPDTFNGTDKYIKALEVLNQLQTSSCVPHAIAELLMLYIYKVTGKKIDISPRFAYKLSKMFDGLPQTDGTYPRICALMFVKFGCVVEELLKNDTSLSSEKYLDFEITDEMLKNASQYKLPGFAKVYNDIESIKLAISKNGAVTGSTLCGSWSSLPVLPFPSRGYHYTVWYGYEKLSNGDYKIYFKNSWGPGWLEKLKNWLFGGYGYFLWSQYKDYVRDIIVFTEIPSDYLKIVNKLPYRFSTNLYYGISHPDVKELQKMLNEDPETVVDIDGEGSFNQETNFFGSKTRSAVIRWQIKNKITPSSGYFGPISIRKANERIGTKTNKIRDWALAIQSFEGFYPGSKSFRNNNPGNIRYSGLFRNLAIKSDQTGFCIFETYEKGLDALEILLTRACSGLSSVYSPEDTLLSFYGKYAPTSDNNYPENYAKAVASMLGVSVNTKIKDLL